MVSLVEVSSILKMDGQNPHHNLVCQLYGAFMKIIEFSEFDDVGSEVSIDEINKYLDDCLEIHWFPRRKIIRLNIPFSEIYHRCSDVEWQLLKQKFSNSKYKHVLNKWWMFWRKKKSLC